jgi:hypothetical protein
VDRENLQNCDIDADFALDVVNYNNQHLVHSENYMIFNVPNDSIKNAADIFISKIVTILSYDYRTKDLIELYIITTLDRNFSSSFSYTDDKIVVQGAKSEVSRLLRKNTNKTIHKDYFFKKNGYD